MLRTIWVLPLCLGMLSSPGKSSKRPRRILLDEKEAATARDGSAAVFVNAGERGEKAELRLG